jgi:NAD(P)-dependent dehydrogenase (short-subunit alcohol dehydrogenase family)
MTALANRTTIVVGASRGFGRGIATALAEAGAPVVAVARNRAELAELAGSSPNIRREVADATDPEVPGVLLDRHEPSNLILVAGAVPPTAPLHEQTWETFSVNWETDVHLTFNWLREALLRPLAPGSRVIVLSSGAALAGSPMSGGYAGAKATQRLMTNYAAEESERAGLGIRFASLLPGITPLGSVGKSGVAAYAARLGITEEEYVAERGPVLTPEAVGDAVLTLTLADDAELAPAYRLSGEGLAPLG